MTLQLWNELHKDMSMTDKKNKTVLITTNIGTRDLRTFGIEEAYQDGDLVTCNCECADKMIRAGVAIEYTDEVKKAREEEAKHVDPNIAAVAQRELAVESAKEEAKKRLKEGPKSQTPKVAKTTDVPEGTQPPSPSEEGAPILKARAGGSAPPINEPKKNP
jgi:hypothetical protein